MKYDVASKVLLSRCKDEILRHFAGLPIKGSTLLETAPQETVSMRRADFALRAELEDGSRRLVLVEFLSSWRRTSPIRLLEYRCRHLLEEEMGVISLMVLLSPDSAATNRYEDEEVRYEFRLVRIPDFRAEEVMELGIPCLFPFVPLMKGGEMYLDEADRRITEGPFPLEVKSDLLTGMAILSGLVSQSWPMRLIERRRDIMIESAAYEIIRQEGYQEGVNEGIELGIEQGLKQGRQDGLLFAIKTILELRFGAEGLKLYPEIKKIEDIDLLETVADTARIAKDIEQIRAVYSQT